MTCDFDPTSSCNVGHLGPSLVEICKFSPFVVFLSLLDQLIRKNEKISGICSRVKPIHRPDDEYDFIVIGGGAGGSPVASRLSENPHWKVLLIEAAGDDEPTGGEVPIFTDSLIGTSIDWNYTITNESYACLSTNGTCPLSASKCLGGSTAHNSMIYIRGNPTDYNNWAAIGNEGWTWEEVKKFFLYSEDNGEIERVGRGYHSTGGLLSVERFPYLFPFGKSVLAASVEAGYGVTDDPNGADVTGFTIAQSTSKKGVRRSSASAYLRPARNRENLHVSLNSLGARVIIENLQAVGVEFYKDGKLRTVRVKREVIVSAGTTRSPQILMLSGIGPKKDLKSMSIPVVKDMPGVGENLHDHVSFQIDLVNNDTDSWDNNLAAVFEYLANQTGPLSQPGLNSVMAALSTNASTPDFPDIQMYFTGYSQACAPGVTDALRSQGRRSVSMRIVNMHPKSRGRVSLASKDPSVYPVSWVNYLSDHRDGEVLVKGIELALALIETKAMRAWNLTLTTEPIEACSDYTFASTEYWACAIHQDTSPELHQAGSCKMGPASDPMAVVDPQLRVHGIKGLRVADASIMPVVTSGNTAAPTMMIGERAADFIKKDLRWKQGNLTVNK